MGEEKWTPPPAGQCKVNWDVSIDSKHKRMGFGIIVRDHNGLVSAAKSEVAQILQEPVTGEAMGALQAA